MSTKSTIAHGPNFHFYHEVMDDDHVYLRLETTEFEAGYGRVMVPIPIHIWETIRHLGGAQLDLINYTDENLLVMVEKNVDERIAEYQDLLRNNPEQADFIGLCGSFVFGGADKPREEQVKNGMEHFRQERAHQREIHAAILKLRESQGPSQRILLNLNERQIAADLLIVLIGQLSQEHFATQWAPEIEIRLWDAATGLTDQLKQEGEQARYLSEKCQGWVVWDKAAGKPLYVTLREWEALYCERLTKKIKEKFSQ